MGEHADCPHFKGQAGFCHPAAVIITGTYTHLSAFSLHSKSSVWGQMLWPVPQLSSHHLDLIDLGYFTLSLSLSLFPAEMKRAGLLLWGPKSKRCPLQLHQTGTEEGGAGHKAFRFKGCYQHQKLTTVSSGRDNCLWLPSCLLLSTGGLSILTLAKSCLRWQSRREALHSTDTLALELTPTLLSVLLTTLFPSCAFARCDKSCRILL